MSLEAPGAWDSIYLILDPKRLQGRPGRFYEPRLHVRKSETWGGEPVATGGARHRESRRRSERRLLVGLHPHLPSYLGQDP